MIKFELVLPCYNESQSIEKIILRSITAAKRYGFNQGEFCLIMVENGSQDSSRKVFQDMENNLEFKHWFKMIPIDINQGYGFGVMTGLNATQAPVVGWSHADQQCDPEDAFKAYFRFVENKKKGINVLVKGLREGRNWKDILVSRVFELVAKIILKLKVYEMNAQPKVFDRKLIEKLRNPPLNFAFDMYVLYHAQKNNIEIQTIPVLFPPRIHGFSNWSSNFFSRYKTIIGIIKYMLKLARTEGKL